MITEKRKRYLAVLLAALMVICVVTGIVTTLHNDRALTRTGFQRNALSGAKGTILARDGTVLYHEGTFYYDKLCGDLIGSRDAANSNVNSMTLNYAAELSAPYSIWTGIAEMNEGGTIQTSLLPPDAMERLTEAFQGRSGAVYAYDYRTGEVLLCLSVRPEGNASSDSNLVLNRDYAPGSTMKVLLMACACEQDPANLTMTADCTGEAYRCKSGESILCSHGPHGYSLNCVEALGNSCNCYFATLAGTLDRQQLAESLQKIGVCVNAEAERVALGDLRRLESSVRLTSLNDGHQIWGMLGQGDTQMSLIDLARVAGAIANDGEAADPCIVMQISRDGTNEATQCSTRRLFSNATADSVYDLWYSATERYYRGRIRTVDDSILCAKTGTAQTGNGKHNSYLLGVTSQKVAFAIAVLDSGALSAADIGNVLAEELEVYYVNH